MDDSRLTRVTLCLSPLVLLASDLWRVLGHESLYRSVAAQLAFVLFVIGLPSVAGLLKNAAGRVRTLTLVSLVVGAMAGAAMIAADRTLWAIREAGIAEAQELVATHLPLFLTIRPPGLLYPIGLLALALLIRPAHAAGWQRAIIALGAILFPVGRIGGVEAANLASAALLALAWWTLVPPNGKTAS